MANSGMDVRELYDRFLETEKKRMELVELCRDQRRKVLEDEDQRQREETSSNDFSSSFKNPPISTLKKTKSTYVDKPNIPDVKLAATFGLGVPLDFNAAQAELAVGAEKARKLAESRAEHSSKLVQLKEQLDRLELETRMLRVNNEKKHKKPRSALSNTVTKGNDNTWLLEEMKKQVEFQDDHGLARTAATTEKAPRPSRSKSAAPFMTSSIVSGVGLFPKKSAKEPEKTALRQMISSHVGDVEKQVEAQRNILEQSEMVEEWRMLMAEKKKAEEDQARARRRRLMLEKKLKTQQERLERELATRGNLKRLEEEDMAYKQLLRSSIISKQRRAEELLKDKEEEVERTREMARMSQRLRQDLRQSVNADSFDKMAQRVKIENAVGRGPRTHISNVSKLKLG